MITFKQKEFWGLALNAGMGALTIGQGVMQGKEAEKQSEETQRLLEAQNRKLEKIAKASKENPEVGVKAAEVLRQKEYAGIGTLVKTVGSAGKAAFGKSTMGNVGMGAAVAGSTYLAGKYIQKDMKKNGMDLDENGNLTQKSYAAPSVIKQLVGSAPMKFVKKHAGTAAMGAAMGGLPLALQYTADKAQAKDMMAATGHGEYDQRQYSVISSVASSMAKGWRTFKSHPGQSISGAVSNLASFGIGGTKNVQKFGEELVKKGTENGSQAAVKAGKWIGEHKTAANVASIVPGAALGTLAWDGTQKAVNKAGETIDPEAYKYKNAKEKAVQ